MTGKIKISEIRRADYNPRIMAEADMSALENSLTTFGFVEPVVINTHPERLNILIGGHQRLTGTERLLKRGVIPAGVEADPGGNDWLLPAVFVRLPVQQEKILNVALNRIHGDWDQDKLQILIAGLAAEGANVGQTGFSADELVRLTAGPALSMPNLTGDEVKTKMINLYYEASIMEEFLKIANRWPGDSISDKVLAMARASAINSKPSVPHAETSEVQGG